MSMAERNAEGWKGFGLVKGIGIPAPTGKHVVGCVDLMHKLEGDSDGLLVRLFYPAHPTVREGDEYPYARLTPNRMYTKGLLEFVGARLPGMQSWLIHFLTDSRAPAFYGAPFYRDAEICGEATEGHEQARHSDFQEDQCFRQYPVIIFSHGLIGIRCSNSCICCDLASHGYVVAAVEHRDGSPSVTFKRVPKEGGVEGQLVDEWIKHHGPDGERDCNSNPKSNPTDQSFRHKQVKTRSFDVKQALKLLDILNDGGTVHNMLDEDRFDFGMFKGCLDLDKAAVMGHSFGGSATVMALSEEPRLKCGVALDGWMFPLPDDLVAELSIKQPLLFINSYDWQWKENVQKMLELTQPTDEHGSEKCLITIKDSNHYNQADVFLSKPRIVYGALIPEAVIDPLIAIRVNLELCHVFLKRNLLKDPDYPQRASTTFDIGEELSKHVIYGTNVDMTAPHAWSGEGEVRMLEASKALAKINLSISKELKQSN